MATLEQIIEEAKRLSPDEQQKLREALDSEIRSTEQEKRNLLSASIRGKYRDILTSSEEFIAGKAEEITQEDHRR